MASDIYGSTQISTLRSPIQNTTVTASHKHLASQSSNTTTAKILAVLVLTDAPKIQKRATPSLSQVLLSVQMLKANLAIAQELQLLLSYCIFCLNSR